MSTDKLKQQFTDLDACVIWLQSIGIRPNVTRVNHYHGILQSYIKAVENGTAQQLQESLLYRDYTDAFYEISELVEIYKGLVNLKINDELKERIKTYVRGPKKIIDENPQKATNYPRDIGFELLIGSRFSRGGYNIIFNNEGDLEFEIGEKRIFIECKRPSSEKRLKESINKAFSQLENRYAGESAGSGLIALSISKLINKNHYILSVPNFESLKQNVQNLVEQFIQNNLQLFTNRSDKRTIGVIVLIELPSYVENKNNFKISTFMSFLGLCSEESNDFSYIRTMYENLSKAINP